MAVERAVVTERSIATGTPAIVADDIHVRFKVYEEQSFTLRRMMSGGFRSRVSDEVHAVKGVTFQIDVGEVVGIVGSNGSGKSTLLRALAGLLQPTSGSVLVRSEPVLLTVRAALKPELSGYRNITIGCLAMGMPMSEIRESIEEVADFTELGEALRRPLRTYSSGMRARLAFAIATLQQPELLFIDEALAVGDRTFKRKSMARIRDLQANAGSIVMVTHNMNEIRATCSRAMWLEQGKIHLDGTVDEVLAAYDSQE